MTAICTRPVRPSSRSGPSNLVAPAMALARPRGVSVTGGATVNDGRGWHSEESSRTSRHIPHRRTDHTHFTRISAKRVSRAGRRRKAFVWPLRARESIVRGTGNRGPIVFQLETSVRSLLSLHPSPSPFSSLSWFSNTKAMPGRRVRLLLPDAPEAR